MGSREESVGVDVSGSDGGQWDAGRGRERESGEEKEWRGEEGGSGGCLRRSKHYVSQSLGGRWSGPLPGGET